PAAGRGRSCRRACFSGRGPRARRTATARRSLALPQRRTCTPPPSPERRRAGRAGRGAGGVSMKTFPCERALALSWSGLAIHVRAVGGAQRAPVLRLVGIAGGDLRVEVDAETPPRRRVCVPALVGEMAAVEEILPERILAAADLQDRAVRGRH